MLTRRTGWTFVWEVRRSLVGVTEGEGGAKWSENVGSLSSKCPRVDSSWRFRDVGQAGNWQVVGRSKEREALVLITLSHLPRVRVLSR